MIGKNEKTSISVDEFQGFFCVFYFSLSTVVMLLVYCVYFYVCVCVFFVYGCVCVVCIFVCLCVFVLYVYVCGPVYGT